MRVLIAEDERHLADDLVRRLARLWPEAEIVAVVHDGLAAREAMQTLAPQIAFLDINMPGLSGLEVARTAPPTCRVVFVTAYDAHAVAAFETAAVDYLLKPVADARLQKSIERLRQTPGLLAEALLSRLQGLLPAQPGYLRFLRVPSGQEVRLLPVGEVCFFQASDKYTLACTKTQEALLRTPVKELLPQLDPALFWQIHRGTLVNVNQIESVKRDLLGRLHIVLRDRSEVLAVSRSYTHLFRQM